MKKIIKILLSIFLFIIGLIIKINYIKLIFFIISYLIIGFNVLKESIESILKGKIFDENFLMSIATIGAFLIGEYSEAIMVMMLYQMGELFEDYAVDKSKKSITDLMDIRPDYANIIKNEKINKVSPDIVKINDVILVKPGEKIPLDGIVIEGNSSIDTKSLTGESLPKKIKKDDYVLSGCINLDSIIKIQVKKTYKESTVNKILEMVENAPDKKTKSENFINKFASIYTPIVVIIAILIGLIPPLVFNCNFSIWLYRSLSFLVASCPCALIISIPLSFFAGIGASSKIGVLVKGSNYLEKMSKIDTIVFDKTGTLTEGIFSVQKINPINISKDDLIKYASYAEYYSNHPIAISIKDKYKHKINEQDIKDIKEIPGKGIEVVIKNKKIIIGNEELMKKNKINYTSSNDIGTICYIAIDNEYKGNIVISDKIKSNSKKVIKELRKHNINNIIMLTGDKKEISEYTKQELKIDKCFYELLPNDKVTKVEELLNKLDKNKILVYIGDGINDAPVLKISDVGISLGGIGSDAAIEASDIVLMTDDLSSINKVINISKKTLRIVKENIYFAILTKIIILILSSLGLASMWHAVFADVGVSFISILNALRILLIKCKEK